MGDAMLGGVQCAFADEGAIVEESLGGDATPIKAGAAEGFHFDAENAFFAVGRRGSRPRNPGWTPAMTTMSN